MKSEQPLHLINSGNEEQGVEDGILSPSKTLFKNIDEEICLNSLKKDVISCIQNREVLIDRARDYVSGSSNQKGRQSRKNQELKTNKIKKLICALHNASLCVVEAIISINVMSQSVDCKDRNSKSSEILSFAWMGENYLMKMLTDFQFMCNMNEVMEILLPERKTLFRNPFLLPLDLDEIVGYEPDFFGRAVSSESKATSAYRSILHVPSDSKAVRMSRVFWNINIDRIKRAAYRIIFEEHRKIYGDSNIVHVFPMTSHLTRKKNNDVLEICWDEYPKVDIVQLKQVLQGNNLVFDDALVLACIRLFLSRDIERVKIQPCYIPRESVFKLALQPLESITDDFLTTSNESGQLFIESPILHTIYVMMMRGEIKSELLNLIHMGPIKQLKEWLLNLIVKQGAQIQWDKEMVVSKKREACRKVHSQKSDVGSLEKKLDDSLEKVELNAGVEVGGRSSHKKGNHEPVNKVQEVSPIPILRNAWVQEGSKTLVFKGEGIINDLCNGEVIRLGHPLQSPDYIISNVGVDSLVLHVAYHIPFSTKENLLPQTTDRLYSPTKNYQKSSRNSSESEMKLFPKAIDRKHQGRISVKIWKLIDCKDDKRLEWRKQFDHGFVPWFPLSLNRYGTHFRVKIEMQKIEKNCRDDTCDPGNSVHQQRLHYFEKVPVDDIISETFSTVCHCWHPTTPNIDNSKWAKLARTMKFLSSVKNANHEVDMAFFRHSHQRKLDPNRFKSVLLDMALRKYSSARYNGGVSFQSKSQFHLDVSILRLTMFQNLFQQEALANMLWTTVVMLPQVNRMIWTKAQMMAVEVELERTCAQIRISARFRMLSNRKIYHQTLAAALCISKNVKCVLAKRKKALTLELAKFYRFYRIRHYSAIVCQKYWRRFTCITNFIEHKRMMKRQRENEVYKIWQELKRQGMERTKNLVFREVVNVQSVLTITTMFLVDRILEGKGIKLEIKVYVPGSKYSFDFELNENDVRESIEKFTLKRGPLSWNEMLKKDVLLKLKERLMAKVSRGNKPIIIFCRRDIAEKGNLIARQLFPSEKDLYVLSFYRSHYDIVVRLYHPGSCEQLRTIIDMSLLFEWLKEDEAMRRKEALGMFRIRDIAKETRFRNNQNSFPNGSHPNSSNSKLPTLLRKEKQNELVAWLKSRIQVVVDEKDQRKKIILQYQAETEHMERVARKFQSIWRANCAKKRARKEVHIQYEKQFDWMSKTFFYVHIKTGVRQWKKPALLRDGEDVKDPPDEWREMEYNDPESGESRTYYMNPLTGQTSWLTQDEAAQIVQRKFRQRQTELLLPSFFTFSEAVRAVSMVHGTEMKYKQKPNKLSNRVNYALLCHCIRFDINTARSLYKDAIIKNSQHPVIARAYGIFILAICQAPLTQTFDKACQLFKQAQKIDPNQKLFQTAKDNFFYWAVIMNPNNGMALLNYALLHQCILGEFYRAEKIYIHALTQDPTNEYIAQNFKLFEDQRYPGGYYEGTGVPYIVVKRSNVFEENNQWGEWKKMIDPMSSKPKFKTFWFNIIDKTSSFEEPDWKMVWQKRIQRSKRITANTKSLWVEFYDTQLHSTFLHNRSSGQFVWEQS